MRAVVFNLKGGVGKSTIAVNLAVIAAERGQRTVQELIDEGLPVLQPYLGSSVKIKESRARALPLIHLEASHPLTQASVELYETLR